MCLISAYWYLQKQKGLSGGHPVQGWAAGTPLRAAEGSVERSLKGAKTCNCLSPDQAAEHTGVLLQSPPQVRLESKPRGTLALLFIQQLPGLNEKLLPKAAWILPLWALQQI